MCRLKGMHTIGLTGGIGAGKTVVADVLRAYSVPVYDSDREAKALYNTDPTLKQSMLSLFGSALYDTEDGELDRKLLASLIFSNRELLLQVNALVHPALRRAFVQWRQEQCEAGKRVCAIESALLLDGGLDQYVDTVCVVYAPKDIRLDRAMRRDAVGREAIEERMSKQRSDSELLDLADYVIENYNGRPIAPQVEALLVSIG